MKTFSKHSIALTLSATLLGSAGLAKADVIGDAFHPYRDQVPQFDGLTPGMVINQANVAQFRDIIDPAFLTFIEQGWV